MMMELGRMSVMKWMVDVCMNMNFDIIDIDDDDDDGPDSHNLPCSLTH